MSTATYEVAESIPLRIAELDVLTDQAKLCVTSNELFYNAICRATAVLLASHLEGFLKDLARSIVLDMNYYLNDFSSLPEAMRKTFCEKIAYYEGVPKADVDKRVSQLQAFFSSSSVQIDMDAFRYKESPNKNASATFIDKVLSDLGVPNAVLSLKDSEFDQVFLGNVRKHYLLRRDFIRLRSCLYNFPFRQLPTKYSFKRANSKTKNESSLWHEFIEALMDRRHRVAHGDTLANEATWEELKSDTNKLEALMYGLAYSSATYLTKKL